MATFRDRLRLILDVDNRGGVGGIKSFGASVREADGFTGKLKAGWASASESIKANASMLALAGGAALIAFATKAVAAFESVAKAAVDLGKQTGLSTEEASRWIAVGDDFQVTADELAGAMGRLGKNIDSEVMKRYGIETRDASGRAKDANGLFLDVLETINNTVPAERARVAAELLGKGWQAVAPLLGHTREEYEKMLGSVEKGQVITAEEAKKAERMRLAQDALADALQEVTLAFGGMAAEAAPAIESAAKMATRATELAEKLHLAELAALALAAVNPFAAPDFIPDVVVDSVDTTTLSLKELQKAIRESGVGIEEATPWIQDWMAHNKTLGQTLQDVQLDLFGTTYETEQMTAAIQTAGLETLTTARALSDHLSAGLKSAEKAATDLLSAELGLINTQLGLDGAVQNFWSSLDTLNDTEDDSTTIVDEHAQALTRAESAALAVAEAAKKKAEADAEANGKTLTAREATDAQILALGLLADSLAPGSELRLAVEGYIAKLESIPREVSTQVKFAGGDLGGGALFGNGHSPIADPGKFDVTVNLVLSNKTLQTIHAKFGDLGKGTK